ncbi:EamA family transporter [Pseudonocardia sp. GCM10023141]|uniref:EamA family transporter n=1 Tax=Pseudonocardia sp. GCM10023141 TaxID=3252653 RepID=UPI003607EB07
MFAPGLGAGVVAVTLAAAVLHAAWNAVAHGIGDRLVGFTLIGIAVTAIAGTAALVTGPPPPQAWPYVLVSAALEAGYQLMLLTSYRLGEFSQVYPLARGTSPWVVALVSVVVLGRPLPVAQLIGVLVVSAGLILLVLLGGVHRAQLPALAAAFGTGLLIAAYTVVDGIGVTTAPVLTYAAWIFLLHGPVLPLIALARRGRALPGQLRQHALLGLTGGAVALVAYGLVLWAQTSGALAAVAALRETSIVVGALLGALFLGERLGARRAVAAAVVAAGAIVISTL